MKMECDMIRDLLPLYADEACSEKSREAVSEHLEECPECREMLQRIKSTEIESDLISEKNEVIRYGEERFRRRSAAVGSVVSALFMIPILVCLVLNILSGSALGWFFVMLASLAVAASLIVVPLMVPENKLFWTFCSFTASLILLLAVTCVYTHGNWFWISSSAVLFGLSVVFLPFLIKAKPVRAWIGNANRLLIVLGLDAVLFINMMNMISSGGKLTVSTLIYTLLVLAGIVFVATEIFQKRRENK